MYAFIRGIVDEVAADRAILEASGVGYELFCSAATLKRLQVGKPAKLLVHFHLAQDVMALYGFLSADERSMFRKLISVARVGPKLALSVLSVLTVSDLATAILTENADALARVPGMGKKTAARVLLEFKERIGSDDMAAMGMPQMAEESMDLRAQTIAALVSLGYDGIVAGRVVAKLAECDTVEEMLKRSLKEIGKSR